MAWSAEDRVVPLRRTVLGYRPFPYWSAVTKMLRVEGSAGSVREAVDVLSVLAEPYRLDPVLLFSCIRSMCVTPEPRYGIEGLTAIDLDIQPYAALRGFLDSFESMPGVGPAIAAVNDALMRGLRGVAADVLPKLGDSAKLLDKGVFALLWDADDVLGSTQDAWGPSDKVGPLLCRDILKLGADSDEIPVAPRQDEIGNFPLRIVRDHQTNRVGLRLHFLTRVAMVPATEVGCYDDRCRLDMPRDPLPDVIGLQQS